jgi:hypothetical protein
LEIILENTCASSNVVKLCDICMFDLSVTWNKQKGITCWLTLVCC